MAYTKYHPVFLNLLDRPCLVVGGGPLGVEKAGGLVEAGAQVTVVTPDAHETIHEWARQGKIELHLRDFEDPDVAPMFLVIAATDDEGLNRRIYEVANSQNKLANAVDDPDFCNFIMAAITKNGPIQIAISSAGCSPALAQRIRDRISRDVLYPEIGNLAEFLGEWRPAVKARIDGYTNRKGFWEGVLSSRVPMLLAENELDLANAEMDLLLGKYQSKLLEAAI
jgi:siroheme synthase-like protein